ncbi:hypothetical protein EC973_006364 [Apophysomyces ossiformis]|uniref:Spc7 kinetochore protein domain-containing protein n=1 Tax=Apophysomyces ossiformis TaxID=679940 RepID=A0A8H7EUI0_9FUNG|nr:hypothetical protein EC973_006364 [Apophysomyces ossiformis]
MPAMYDSEGGDAQRKVVDDEDDERIVIKHPIIDSTIFDESPISSPRRHPDKRPDLFGSPSASITSPRRDLSSHINEMRKRRFEEDNIGEYPMDFMQYMSSRKRLESPQQLFPDDTTSSPMHLTGEVAGSQRLNKETVHEDREVHDTSPPRPQSPALIRPEKTTKNEGTTTQDTEAVTMELTMKIPSSSSPLAVPAQNHRRTSVDDQTVTMELTQEMYMPPVKQSAQSSMDTPEHKDPKSPHIPNVSSPNQFIQHQRGQSAEPSSGQNLFRQSMPLARSAGHELTGSSLTGSDYADQTIYLHENTNVGDIFDEQFPEHYNSFADEEPLSENVTLAEFVKMVGVTLPENLPLEERRRTSGFNSQRDPATRPKQVAAAAATMPMLETYRTYCEKIKEQIETSKEIVTEIDNRVSDTKPAIFSRYLEGDVQTRFEIELLSHDDLYTSPRIQERIQSLKDYTSLKAKKTCLEWRNKFTDEVKELLKKNLEKIRKDKQYLRDFENSLTWNESAVTAYKKDLQRLLEEARQKEEKYKKIDHAEVARLQEELNEKRTAVQLLKGEGDALQRRELMLSNRLSSIERQKITINEAIEKARKIRDDNKFVTATDVHKSKEQLDSCKNLCGLRLVRQAGSITEITIGGDLNIVMDSKKLEQKSADAVSVGVLEDRKEELEAFVELVPGLRKLLQNQWDQTEIIRNIVVYWQRAKSIHREMKRVQRYYWIELEKLEDEKGDLDSRGVSVRIVPFNYAGRIKITLGFHIRPKDVMAYPAIDLTSLYVKLHYGHISQGELEEIISKDLKAHGVINLADTLQSIIKLILDFSPKVNKKT